MVSSAPTILRPWVWVPSTPSTLFSICNWYWNENRTKINEKEAGIGPYFNKPHFWSTVTTFYTPTPTLVAFICITSTHSPSPSHNSFQHTRLCSSHVTKAWLTILRSSLPMLLSPTPTLVAFFVVTLVHGPSPQSTACWSYNHNNKSPGLRQGLSLLRSRSLRWIGEQSGPNQCDQKKIAKCL